MRSTRDFFVGIVTGLSVGLLVAPRTGEESRRWLKAEYDKRTKSSGPSDGPGLKEQVTTIFEQLKEQVNNYIGQNKNHTKRMEDNGRFDYQVDRTNQLSSQVTTPPAHGGLHEHKTQIISE